MLASQARQLLPPSKQSSQGLLRESLFSYNNLLRLDCIQNILHRLDALGFKNGNGRNGEFFVLKCLYLFLELRRIGYLVAPAQKNIFRFCEKLLAILPDFFPNSFIILKRMRGIRRNEM